MLKIDDMIDEVQEVSSSQHDVGRINSIGAKYREQRQDSKMPTFALTYQGTYMTLVAKGGFTKEVARQIESRYHDLYQESDKWVAARLDEASKCGYITAAFGLRVRTPRLAQVIRGTKSTPKEAEAEGRTAGNALGQSYGLLNSRAWVEFMQKVRADPVQRMAIRPFAQIHDAGYAMIRDDIDTVLYMNEHLVKAVEWQDLPDIRHPEVKLGGELSIFYPSWKEEAVIPNGATKEDVFNVIENHMKKLEKEAG